jgi:phosphopantothenoylcysteine decarboxylase/phosphopantothenate--cysteine ligase
VSGKFIVGMCGSSMAESADEIVKVLCDRYGDQPRVVLSPSAEYFAVNPLRDAGYEFFCDSDWKEPLHISLSKASDFMIISPITANSLVKLSLGMSDNLLLATALSMHGRCVVLPATNRLMWESPAVRESVRRLAASGFRVCDPLEVASLDGGNDGRAFDVEMLLGAAAEMAADAVRRQAPSAMNGQVRG